MTATYQAGGGPAKRPGRMMAGQIAPEYALAVGKVVYLSGDRLALPEGSGQIEQSSFLF